MSNPQYYYMDASGQQVGPVSFDDLRQLASNGTIQRETLVWCEGMAEWAAASGVDGLFPEAKTAGLSAPEWHYLDAAGQQVGPVSFADLQKLASDGTIQAETMVWSPGMENWAAASTTGGLVFPGPEAQPLGEADYSVTVPVRLMQEPSRPGEAPIQPQPAAPGRPALLTGQPAAAQPVPTAQGQPAVAMAQPTAAVGQAAPTPYGQPQMQALAPVGGEYPIPFVKRASYGLFAGLYGVGLLLELVGMFMVRNESGATFGLGLMGLGSLVLVAGAAMGLVFLYRAWILLQPGGASTTPGKAVGFLFIPLFSLYWIFIAVGKWPSNWNRIIASYPNLSGAPRASEGIFLTWAICTVVPFLFPVTIIMMFVGMKQLCSSINFMHDLKTAQQLKQQGGGGIRFY